MAALCRKPVQVQAPAGDTLQVGFTLHFSAFFGYDEEVYPDIGSLESYIGTECHGSVFPFSENDRTLDWPLGEGLLAGKVRQI